MSRETFIKEAADKYIAMCSTGTYCSADPKEAFIEGADFADAHPRPGLVNLSQVWHNSKEEPEKGKSIISIGKTGVSTYKWVDEWRCDWSDFAEWSELIGWAYADDLLPKGGKLCKNKF